jgi:hypothetical protein
LIEELCNDKNEESMSLDIVFNQKPVLKDADNSFSSLFKKACEMGDEQFKKME